MSGDREEPVTASASAARRHVGDGPVEAAREALKFGPKGALVIASTTVLLLILGWLAFYFLLFIPRGAIG